MHARVCPFPGHPFRQRSGSAAHAVRLAALALAALVAGATGPLGGVRAHAASARTLVPAAVTAGNWQPLPAPVDGSAPLRRLHSLVIDPVRRCAYSFGGTDGFVLNNDTWVTDLAGAGEWRMLRTQGARPAARRNHAAVWDPVRGRMLVLMGYSGGYLADIWALDLTGTPTWSKLTTAGTAPSARAGFACVYDAANDRVVLFGGTDKNTARRSDTWQLALSGTPTWSPILPSGDPPPARSGRPGVYDAANQRMLVFGGYDFYGPSDETWALSLSGAPAWTLLATTGTPPAPRSDDAVAWDPVAHRLYVYGGYDADAGHNFGDLFALDCTVQPPVWSPLTSATPFMPAVGYGPAAVWDETGSRFILHGEGYRPSSVQAFRYRADEGWTTWSWDGLRWGRQGHAGAFDASHRRFVFFGGGDELGSLHDDAWELALDDANRNWRLLPATGWRPAPRRLHGAALDAARDRLVVFGGFDGGYRNDLLATSLGDSLGSPLEWSPLAAGGTPPSPRADFSLVADPVQDRLVLFGGMDGVSPPAQRVGDLWQLTLAGTPQWSPLAAAGTPPTARSGHRAVYDSARGRMLVVGGFDTAPRCDVWALDLGPAPAWSQLSPSGPIPNGRSDMLLAYDPGLDRVLMFGGVKEGGFRVDELWELTLSPAPKWNPLSMDQVGEYALSFGGYDPVRGQLVSYGGFGPYGVANVTNVWTQPDSAIVAGVVPPRGAKLALGVRAAPVRGDEVVFDVGLASGSPAMLELFDVSGRRGERVNLGVRAAGSHVVPVRLANTAPGVWFARLTQAGESRLVRFVRVR
jgi:hypothetical protein